MSNNVTYHTTEEADVLFMAAARPLKDKATGKEEFTIKLRLLDDSETVKHLLEVSEAKIDTKTNRKLEGEKHVNFSSTFAPVVVGADGVKLEDKAIPFFDSRKDKARAVVTYKVITYPTKTLVRLQGIKLVSVDLAPREGQEGTSSVAELISKIQNA